MDAATTQPGVRPFDMTGRPMRGIVVIDSSVLDDQAVMILKGRSYTRCGLVSCEGWIAAK